MMPTQMAYPPTSQQQFQYINPQLVQQGVVYTQPPQQARVCSTFKIPLELVLFSGYKVNPFDKQQQQQQAAAASTQAEFNQQPHTVPPQSVAQTNISPGRTMSPVVVAQTAPAPQPAAPPPVAQAVPPVPQSTTVTGIDNYANRIHRGWKYAAEVFRRYLVF